MREADVAVALGGTTSTETYLDIAKIIEAARKTGADAIHPGYGFLSENAGFAEACAAAGVTFIGPSPRSMPTPRPVCASSCRSCWPASSSRR